MPSVQFSNTLGDHVVIPPAVVIPRDEDSCTGPETAFDNGVHLIDGPLHAGGHVSRRVLAEGASVDGAGSIDPQTAGSVPAAASTANCSGVELFGLLARSAMLGESVPSVVFPGQPGGLEDCLGKDGI